MRGKYTSVLRITNVYGAVPYHMRIFAHTRMGWPIHVWAAHMHMGTRTRMAAPYVYGQRYIATV